MLQLAKKQEEYDQAQTAIDGYQREIAALQGENKVSARRIQEMSEQKSSRRLPGRNFFDDNSDDESRPLQDDDSMDVNEETLLVEAPNFDTPSRRKRNIHPTLRVLQPKDVQRRANRSEGSNVIAFASDEEEGQDELPNKRMKTVQGHARNPFATGPKENVDNVFKRITERERKNSGLSPGSRLHEERKVIVLDGLSDPPEGFWDELEAVQMPVRDGRQDNNGRQQERLVGGKRHVLHPPAAGRSTARKQPVVLGNRAIGPKVTRRAV